MAMSPICCMQPRKTVPYCCASHFLATAPAATIGAVRRAEARPPPRGIAQAVLLQVGVVGVARAEGLRDLAVVLAALVGVADQQADRRAGGLAFVDAREDLHPVRFLALGDVAAGARDGAGPGRAGCRLRDSSMPGGQPSITQPMAGPCDSPKLVTANRVPKVLPLMPGYLPNRSHDQPREPRDYPRAAGVRVAAPSTAPRRPASRGCRP